VVQDSFALLLSGKESIELRELKTFVDGLEPNYQFNEDEDAAELFDRVHSKIFKISKSDDQDAAAARVLSTNIVKVFVTPWSSICDVLKASIDDLKTTDDTKYNPFDATKLAAMDGSPGEWKDVRGEEDEEIH
jgi:hypothetical protein